MTEKRFSVKQRQGATNYSIKDYYGELPLSEGIYYKSNADKLCEWLNTQHELLNNLYNENEQLKFKLEEVKSDEKQLGISFMEFKMKLIEKLQIHYDYATEQKQKNLNDIFVAKAYDIIRYDIKKLAEEMGVDLE